MAQAKPISCFACNKPGHWRAQCSNTAKLSTGHLLAAGDPEQFEGVVNSIIVSNSSNDIFDDDFSNSGHLDKAVEVKSPLNYEFTSGQYNSPSPGPLSFVLYYDQWVKLGASGFILSVVRDDRL